MPARTADAKLIASFCGRPATSLGLTLSPAAVAGETTGEVATSDGAVAPEGVFAVAFGVPSAAMESAVEVAPPAGGAGGGGTAPALPPGRRGSGAQAGGGGGGEDAAGGERAGGNER